MPQEPKRRHSIARKGKRRAGIKLAIVKSVICPNCKSPRPSHAICPNCGFYKGKQVITKSSPKTKNSEE